MATRDYQVVTEITWSDKYLVNSKDKAKDKHSTLRMSYALYGKALDEATKHGLNEAVEAKSVKIIYKPTGMVMYERDWAW